MGILEKLGLASKSKVGAPSIGEKKRKEQEEAAIVKRGYFRWAILVGFLIILIYSLPQTSFRQVENYTIGEPWRADDLTAPFTFALQKTEAEVEEERDQIRENIPPIFYIDESVHILVDNNIDSVFHEIQPVLDRYVQWQRAERDPDISASNDSLQFFDEREQAGVVLDESSWNMLQENYATIQFENISPQQFIGNRIRSQINSTSNAVLNSGFININKNEITSNELTLRDYEDRTERTVRLGSVSDQPEVRSFARSRFSDAFDDDIYARTAEELFNQIIQPNWIYSENDTRIRMEEALEDISPTKGAVAQGQVIVRRGDIVTEETANMLESLAEVRADTASTIERWLRFGGEVMILIIATLFFLFYLYLYRKKIFENSSMFLLVFLVLGIIILANGLVYNFEQISPYIVPVAIAPLILTIIFDSRVGLLAAITLGIITAVFHDNNFEYLIATVMACSFGVFSVRDINKRTQFFVTTPFVVFLSYVLVVTGFSLTRFGGFENYLNQLGFIAANAVFILFTYPLILFFEKMFDITTDFTLLELADTNLPLLKDLMNNAPGTFHHSLQVSNLAESAASAIGANALLCRVGALYHDIGKMTKPAYFIENQSGRNEHDNLKPRMSALVIKAHVSDGVKMAEEHDLPNKVIQFIRTHHGTNLIKYFYDRALRSSGPDADIREEDFRYDGPIPDTKETGILLLADGIEAASRSMKDPTYSKLENLINRMVDDLVHEGQLNHCPLTFHQLDIIKKTFLNILLGVYHHRVEYPEKETDRERREKQEQNESDRSKPGKKAELTAGKQDPEESIDGGEAGRLKTGNQDSAGPGKTGQSSEKSD